MDSSKVAHLGLSTVFRPLTLKHPSPPMKEFFTDFEEGLQENKKKELIPKWRGSCKLCLAKQIFKPIYTDSLGTTSNFLTHLKGAHRAQYEGFQRATSSKTETPNQAQPTIAEGFSNMMKKYPPSHPRQILLSDSIIDNLIIRCDMPVYVVEKDGFRDFMKDADSKWQPCGGKWISSKRLPEKFATGKEKLKQRLSFVNHTAGTLDIWSDRRMRGYMGITAHWVDPVNFELWRACLGVVRIKGSHTAINILEHLDSIMIEFGIKFKSVRIVSDDAANMKKAFAIQLEVPANSAQRIEEETIDVVHIPSEDEADTSNNLEQDCDPTTEALQTALDQDLSSKIDDLFQIATYKRLGCINHAFHNVVGDGLKEAGARVGNALAKVRYFANLLHKSTKFFDCMEEAFGKELGLDRSVQTRWNSAVGMAESFFEKDEEKFFLGLEKYGERDALAQKPSVADRAVISEVISVLELFIEATQRTEGEKHPTLNYAAPLVLGIIRNLTGLLVSSEYCRPMIYALLSSMYRRFNGLLQMLNFKTQTDAEPPFLMSENANGSCFQDEIYLVAPLLDPTIKLSWIDAECFYLSEEEKIALKQKVELALVKFMPADTPAVPPQEPPELLPVESNLAAKKPRLMQFQVTPTKSNISEKTCAAEIFEYLKDTVLLQPSCFWATKKFDYPKLAAAAMTVLCVPASSSPIERVFSHAGYICRPHRSKMSYRTLQCLIFLKVNANLLSTL